MGYRRRKGDHKTKNSSFLLNITSMTDMFTIMLVFLLQTYASSDVVVTPEKDISLPVSKVDKNPIHAIQLSLSPSFLKIDGKTLANLEKGQFNTAALDPNDPNFIQPLFESLKKIADTSKKQEDQEGNVFLIADQSLPYESLKKVMYTASMAGFPKLKLATMLGD